MNALKQASLQNRYESKTALNPNPENHQNARVPTRIMSFRARIYGITIITITSMANGFSSKSGLKSSCHCLSEPKQKRRVPRLSGEIYFKPTSPTKNSKTFLFHHKTKLESRTLHIKNDHPNAESPFGLDGNNSRHAFSFQYCHFNMIHCRRPTKYNLQSKYILVSP